MRTKYPIILIIKSTLRVSLHHRSYPFFSSSGILSFPFRHPTGGELQVFLSDLTPLLTFWALSIITSFPFFQFWFCLLRRFLGGFHVLLFSDPIHLCFCLFPLSLVSSFMWGFFIYLSGFSSLFLFWVLYIVGCFRVWFMFFYFFLMNFSLILCWFEMLEQLGFGKFVMILPIASLGFVAGQVLSLGFFCFTWFHLVIGCCDNPNFRLLGEWELGLSGRLCSNCSPPFCLFCYELSCVFFFSSCKIAILVLSNCLCIFFFVKII